MEAATVTKLAIYLPVNMDVRKASAQNQWRSCFRLWKLSLPAKLIYNILERRNFIW